MEPLLRGHPDKRTSPLERPLDNVNLNINVLISTPDERPPFLKGHFSDAKGVASQEGFHCIHINILIIYGADPNFKTACTYPGTDAGELVGVVIVPLFEHGSDGSGQQVHDGLTQVTHLDRQRGTQAHDDRVHTHGLGRGRTLVRRLDLTHYTQSEMQNEEFFLSTFKG